MEIYYRRENSKVPFCMDMLFPSDINFEYKCSSLFLNTLAGFFGRSLIFKYFLSSQIAMLFVSKLTQLTSDGGSYMSKNLESTPIKNGNGACKT